MSDPVYPIRSQLLPHAEPTGGARGGSLRLGQVRSRPAKNSSQAHPGVSPVTPFSTGSQKFQPLPNPLGQPPYHYDLESALPGVTAGASDLGKLVFHTVGDTGGIKSPDYQTHVAAAMKGDLNKPHDQAPKFFYHLGDVVYYNGQVTDYYSQFYEPYDHYDAPIFAIPGNHDGDPIDATQTSLDGWVRYFMTSAPSINPESHDAPRATMSLPNVYYTLNCPFATLVGLYTNVPEHGSIESLQQQWFTNEFATAPHDKALIVALHHPVYSFDDHHSGSAAMADVLQHAINDSRRVPNLVLTAHVHNYQRIERTITEGGATPFLVAGNGGYYHLHGMNIDPPAQDAPQGSKGSHGKHPVPIEDQSTQAKLIYSNHTNHGYLTVTVDKDTISGVASTVEEANYPAAAAADTFSYTAKALYLAKDAVVSL